MSQADILTLLNNTLNPDGNIRIQAELHLAQANSYSPGSSLKKYVKEQWSPFFPEFKGPQATTVEIKEQVRSLIFGGLSDPIRKIRLACASILSLIAHPDWPDDWPSLTTQLLSLASSEGGEGSQYSVDGSMRVLHDFVGVDLTEDQLLPMAREMLPMMMKILGNPETHSPSIRARSILIFRQCVMTLFTVKEEHPIAVKSAVSEILPEWIKAFLFVLEGGRSGNGRSFGEVLMEEEGKGNGWEEVAVWTAIYKTLEIVLESFPSTLKLSLPTFLSLTLTHLSSLLQSYHSTSLSSSNPQSRPIPTSGESEDKDSEVSTDLSGLIGGMLDFVGMVGRRKGLRGSFLGSGGEVVGDGLRITLEECVEFARMTTEDEENWASDPNAFVADEDDEMIGMNVRSAALDLVSGLVDIFGKSALSALWNYFEKQAMNSDRARAANDPDWWKGYESALTVVGVAAPELLEHVQESAAEGKASVFDLGRVFSSVIPAYLGDSAFPFLQGRSFVFASKFSQALPNELATQYIDAAIQVLENDEAGVPVKVSAVRALNNFFRHLQANIDHTRAAKTFSKLLPLVPLTTENTLYLVIETIEATLRVAGTVLDQEATSALIKIVLVAWFDSTEDPLLSAVVCQLFEALSKVVNPTVQHILQAEALPSLANLLSEVNHDPYSTKASASLEVINSIFDGQPTPLTPSLFATVAGQLFNTLAIVEDRDMLQTGLNIITTVVRKDVKQLLDWRNEQGQTGLDLVLAVVAKLLQPSQSEAGGLYVGDLVLHLIRQAGEAIGPVLPELLRAFVNRLATAQTASFSQSLILPFLYLIHTQSDTVLSLLESISVPATKSRPVRSALEVLLSTWCEYAEFFQGYWNQKVSTVALTQLFSSSRATVQQITVKGDLIITAANSNAIMTRSRAKNNPDQFTQVPFSAKALKILLHDVQLSGDDATLAKGVNAEDVGSDDGDEEWDDEGGEFQTDDKDLDFLSDLLGKDSALSKYMNDDDDEAALVDEEDLKDDPIYQLDIQVHLSGFFKQVYANDTNHFREVAKEFLSEPEKRVLEALLQSA